MTNQSDTSTLQHQDEQTCENHGTAGAMLKKHREQKGITVGTIAERLKIPDSYITAIESDQYQVLPEMTFVQGYIRSYARLLDLDESEVSRKLKSSLSDKNFFIKGMPKRKKTISLSVLFMSIFIVIITAIGGLTGVWIYHNHHPSSAKSPSTETMDKQFTNSNSGANKVSGVSATLASPGKSLTHARHP